MSREELLTALQTVGDLPKSPKRGPNHRKIYEWGDARGRGTGRFGLDYATFPGGTTKEVPISLIAELEREGVIVRAFPNSPQVRAWVLRQEGSHTGNE